MSTREQQIVEEMTTARAHAAMTEGLMRMIRERVAEMVQDAARPVLDAIVEETLKDFEATVKSYVAGHEMVPTLKIVVDYKSKRVEDFAVCATCKTNELCRREKHCDKKHNGYR